MVYTTGFYNKYNDSEQWVRITDGCLNQCSYCYAPKELIYYNIPEIIRNKVKIIDMNLLLVDKKLNLNILNKLPEKVNNKFIYYELVCGVDYRYITQEITNLMKEKHFINIRFAWDYDLNQQYKMKDTFKMFIRAGYKPRDISVFVLCDYKVSYLDSVKKLDLLKVWNVKINDTWYDNVIPPDYHCTYWSLQECKLFRHLCRKHNQLVRFGLDPELLKND